MKMPEGSLELIAEAVSQLDYTVFLTNAEGRIVYTNAAFERLTGYALAEVLGKNANVLKSGQHSAAFYAEMWRTIKAGSTWFGRFINKRKDGTVYTEGTIISPIRGPEGDFRWFLALRHDITREVELEAALSQLQKMEALGRLAGSIAHDFNNILTVITGYAALFAEEEALPKELRAGAAEMLKTSARGKELIGQLLAFSRNQSLELAPLDMNAVISGMAAMLQTLLEKNIRLRTDLAPGLCRVMGNRGQLEQVIMNLAVNARDAMPSGGTFTVRTAFAAEGGGPAPAEPGCGFLKLSFEDTGTGIPPEVLPNIFEPFFTTKPPGKGTGLGLATVYSIVRGHGGSIEAASEPGKGTRFEILLPSQRT